MNEPPINGSKPWYSSIQRFSVRRTEDGEYALQGSLLGLVFAVVVILLFAAITGAFRMGKLTPDMAERMADDREAVLSAEFRDRIDVERWNMEARIDGLMDLVRAGAATMKECQARGTSVLERVQLVEKRLFKLEDDVHRYQSRKAYGPRIDHTHEE